MYIYQGIKVCVFKDLDIAQKFKDSCNYSSNNKSILYDFGFLDGKRKKYIPRFQKINLINDNIVKVKIFNPDARNQNIDTNIGYIVIRCGDKYDIYVEDLFRRVAVISENELTKLKEVLKKISNSYNIAGFREILYNCLLDEMLALYGEDMSGKETKTAKNVINQMTINDIWKSLFGIEFAFDSFKGENHLMEIKRNDIFDNDWIDEFYKYIQRSFEKIYHIDYKNYIFSDKIDLYNNHVYYIPINYLP